MSHFYADIQGNRGQATRQGTKQSGISGHIRGWGVGAFVECYYDKDLGKDFVRVYLTSGSSNSKKLIGIGVFSKDDLDKERK